MTTFEDWKAATALKAPVLSAYAELEIAVATLQAPAWRVFLARVAGQRIRWRSGHQHETITALWHGREYFVSRRSLPKKTRKSTTQG